MKTENITYSVLPSVHKFFVRTELDPSPLQSMCSGMMKAQMNLSRLIMYKESDPNDRTHELVRDAMDIIADMYETLTAMDAERKKYDEMMATM